MTKIGNIPVEQLREAVAVWRAGTSAKFATLYERIDDLVDEIEHLRSILSKHAECETMINQELKDVRAKLAVFQEG